jgi:hypothetical protein
MPQPDHRLKKEECNGDCTEYNMTYRVIINLEKVGLATVSFTFDTIIYLRLTASSNNPRKLFER